MYLITYSDEDKYDKNWHVIFAAMKEAQVIHLDLGMGGSIQIVTIFRISLAVSKR
jgi:hypothetical protein